MKELVEYIVKQLVTNPDSVIVEETTDGSQVNLLLKVDPKDMGIVIGKAGQTIKSIRKLLLVKAISDGVRVNLQLFDESRPEGHMRPEEATQNDSEKSEDQSVGEPEKSESGDPTLQAPQDDTTEVSESDSTSQAPLNDEEKTAEPTSEEAVKSKA